MFTEDTVSSDSELFNFINLEFLEYISQKRKSVIKDFDVSSAKSGTKLSMAGSCAQALGGSVDHHRPHRCMILPILGRKGMLAGYMPHLQSTVGYTNTL